MSLVSQSLLLVGASLVEYPHNILPSLATGLPPFQCAPGYRPPLLPKHEWEAIDGGPVYLVHRLLRSRRRGKGLQYLVDWEAYGPEVHEWVPAPNIFDLSLITDFHQANPNQTRGTSRVVPTGEGLGFYHEFSIFSSCLFI